jgi:predicted nucleic acid-binding protein
VNVWIALLDDAHQFSEEANAFIGSPEARIATCPLVENGVIRIMAMPSYSRGGGLPMSLVRQRLQQACASLDHAFWPDDVSGAGPPAGDRSVPAGPGRAPWWAPGHL